MMKYVYGLLLGVLFIAFGFVRLKKNRQSLAEIPLEQYQKAEFSKGILPWLGALLVLSLIGIYLGIKENNDPLVIVSIGMVIESVVEAFIAKELMVFYYNDERCVVDNKQLLYKNIKHCLAKTKLPISRGTVITYKGEHFNIYHQAIAIINEHLNK